MVDLIINPIYRSLMENSILYIGSMNLSLWSSEILEYTRTLNLNTELLIETSIEAAYNHLFSQKVGLIMADSTITGVQETVSMLKSEEMLRHIPVIILIEKEGEDIEKSFLLQGADRVISKEKIKRGLLFASIKSLIDNNILMSEKITKTSILQEKAINDFILLDLIKAYIPKTIWKVAQECAHMQKIKLPEEERVQTIVFGDIKSFTKMSQHLPPKEVISTLNEVYEVVTRHIYTHNGDVDKFVGDAFFGIFNSAQDAIRSMVLIQKELEKVNARRKKESLHEILFRIGIHTGPVIRGNVGGHNRYDNTLIGDTVNTASRLEHISPVGDVVISNASREAANLEVPNKYRSSIELRGRDCKIQIYSVYKILKEDLKFLHDESEKSDVEAI